MKRTSLYILLFMSQYLIVSGQGYIQTDAHQMAIMDMQTEIKKSLSYLDPPTPDDPLAIRLYKQYFNPVSFEAYRNFFLGKDWGGFSESDFNAWQTYLRNNLVTLEKTMKIVEDNGQEYIVCHYTVETNEYKFPSIAIFKKVGQSWKHISFKNDPQAYDLKHIGLLKTESITSLRDNGSAKKLSSLQQNNMLEPIEKFDRSILFGKIREALQLKEVSDADLNLSEQLFVEKAEVEMVKYLARSYALDTYDLMEELNTAMGFNLFKFARTVKSN